MRVTVGIPFFNNEKTLLDAIKSVFCQTFQDWELILIDDGSSDNSLNIARRIKDPRVRLISDGVNKGLSARLNQIALLAKGEYIARMDADDIMHPNRLQKQVEFLDAHPDVDFVATATYIIDDRNQVTGKRGDIIRGDIMSNISTKDVLRRPSIAHPTITGRTVWFRNNPYDPLFGRAQDLELWCRTFGRVQAAILSEPLFFYRELGSFNISKYIASKKKVMKIITKYGPSIVGYLGTFSLLSEEWMKCIIYKIFTLLGLEQILICRRSKAISDKEKEMAEKVISDILSTSVPGINQA